tara:strand:+ start:6683 stop:10222 length:3540 start_codon:yes stop_codon:yes gene_type:complete
MTDIVDVARRVQYTGNGSAGPFSFSFQVNATTEIKVFVGTTQKTITTHYTVSLTSSGAGSVSFTSGNFPTSSETITIVSSVSLARSSVYTTGGPLTASALEADFDTNIMILQQSSQKVDRALAAPEFDATTIDMTLPEKDSRKGKILGFNATSGNPEVVGENATVTTIFNAIGDNTLTLTGVITGGSLVADNITIDGTEIDLSSGDLTIDVAGDIYLDADGGDIFLRDAGATYGSLTNNSGNLIIKSGTTTSATFTGANVAFAGNVTVDGNLDVTGSFDMSDANITNIGSIALDTITSDGNTITLDATTDIVLDAGGADVTLKDDGSTFGSLTNNSGELQIKSGSTPTAAIEFSGANTTLKGNLTVDGNLSMGTDSITNVTTIAANSYLNNSGDLTLDSSSNIVLDADGSHIFLKNNGTEFGALVDSSGQLHIRSGSDGTSSSNTAIELSNGNVTFSNTVTISSTNHLRFGDSGTYIHQSADGVLDLVSDNEIEINATTIDMNGAVDISGNLSIGGNLDVTGSFDMSDANITNIGSIALDTITNDGSDITLDSSGTIILDADNSGQIEFKDNGVSYGSVNSSGGTGMNLLVSQADENFEIYGTDGSTVIKALEISMANDGAALFKSSVTATSFVGALTGNVSGNVSGNAETVTITANNSANETVYPVFVDGATGTQGLESDTGLSYNPSTGLLSTDSLITGASTFTGNVSHNDNVKAIFGTAGDLEIYHDSAGSYIDDTGTGRLFLRGSDRVQIQKYNSDSGLVEDGITFLEDGAVKIYHDNAKKLETTSSGVTVTGSVTVDNIVASSDLTIDAGGGDILLKDDGALVGTLGGFASNNVVIKSEVSDGDVIIQGNDGGSGITALTLDMSQAGEADFNSAIKVGGGIVAHQTNRGVLEYSSNNFMMRAYGASSGDGFITFKTGGGGGSTDTEALRLDSSQNATFAGSVTANNIVASGAASSFNSGGTNVVASFTSTDATSAIQLVDNTGNVELSALGNTFQVQPGGGSAALIVKADAVLVGMTSDNYLAADDGIQLVPTGSIRIGSSGTSAKNVMSFVNNTGGTPAEVGVIQTSGSSTTYATSSDYRLKENVVTDWDATSRLKELKPSRFNFKIDKDKTVDGFLAHEVSSIVPEAVTGTKDEVDEDGNAVMQGIDQSKLVPLLVKTIQELEARIAKLEGG